VKSAEIREAYLSFFESKGCRRLPSSSLIPDDPSLLLTSAGMVQFKPVFLGIRDLGFTRATTCQKCARTTDIDIIGTTARHHSFFEMLGNFSFGDYFKSEACAWAYEFSTEVLHMDPSRLWFTIYDDDDEAEAVWRDEVGVPADRIVRMGAEDNFWAAGPTGPCGPCSELYYDQGPDFGCGSPNCGPACECGRFLEYWNLVFMQYDRDENGVLTPLPKRNIDTGMGLERVAAILQRVPSNFETDILRSIMAVAESVSGVAYGTSDTQDVSLRIITDHARAVTFLISDGVLPSNEGRGYVLRRVLRRAVRHGRLLGIEGSFLNKLIDEVIARMGGSYPEIVEHRELVAGIVESEEQRFGQTLKQGLSFLSDAIERARDAGLTTLDGREAFSLHDTYGFPYELTAEIAAEVGMDVDKAVFESEMNAQRERGRAAVKDEVWTAFGGVFADIARAVGTVDFVGYEHDEAQSTVAGIVVDGASVDHITAGQKGDIVLHSTPFYAERGGQLGDQGMIRSTEASFQVEDALAPVAGLVSHRGFVESGTLSVGDAVTASIDVLRRERIRRNHTATHILHWALRLVLGEHVGQAGSLVAPERLRFDFTHFEALSSEQLSKVERLINAKIMENHVVRNYETSLSTAREMGVTALFGEKYGQIVRVLEVGNFSKELCGGTHVGRTAEIGFLKIVSEGSVGANVRRIEAVTSFDALEYMSAAEQELDAVATTLKVPRDDVAERVSSLVARAAALESEHERAREATVRTSADGLLAGVVDVGYALLVARTADMGARDLRELSDILRVKMSGGAVVLAAADPENGRPTLLAAGSEQAVAAGFDANAIIHAVSSHIQGGGGGKPSMAQAGGKQATGIDAALAAARAMLGVS